MNKHDIAKKINDLLIIKQDDSSYHLFGQYIITMDDNLYMVTHQYDAEIKLKFTQLKHAVTWCVFHKNKKHKDLPKIAELDEILGGLQVTIHLLKKLADKATTEDKSIYLAKLLEDKFKRYNAQKAMNDYIVTSKYWQTKTFKENQAIHKF